MESEHPTIDLHLIEETVEYLSAETLIEFLNKMRLDVPKICSQMRTAQQTEKYEDVHRLAHMLKGNFGQLGMIAARECARQLNEEASPIATDHLITYIAQIEALHNTAQNHIRQWLQDRNP